MNADETLVRIENGRVDLPLRGMSRLPERHDARMFLKGGKPHLRALEGINLDISRGERIGVTGGNGSGKTTLLRLVSGMLPLDGGSLRISAPVRPLLSLGAGTMQSLTGRQNACLRYSLLEISSLSREDYIEDVARFADLKDFFDMPASIYSPGMLSRLQFAMNTVEPTGVLVIDEWLGVSDRDFHEKARNRLMGMVDRSEALLLASHDEGLVAELTTRRIVLDAGRIVQDGDT